jgi:ureidoacrylate peracid hydrolase
MTLDPKTPDPKTPDPKTFDPRRTALLTIDLQNDFLHPDGAYGRAGQGAAAITALPARIRPVRDALQAAGGIYISAQFTLIQGPSGPLIAPHLARLRPFLTKGDFAPGSFGHDLVDTLKPADYTVEKVAYSALYQTRLEYILRHVGIDTLIIGGIVTNGGVASTVRDAHLRNPPHHCAHRWLCGLSRGCARRDPFVACLGDRANDLPRRRHDAER